MCKKMLRNVEIEDYRHNFEKRFHSGTILSRDVFYSYGSHFMLDQCNLNNIVTTRHSFGYGRVYDTFCIRDDQSIDRYPLISFQLSCRWLIDGLGLRKREGEGKGSCVVSQEGINRSLCHFCPSFLFLLSFSVSNSPFEWACHSTRSLVSSSPCVSMEIVGQRGERACKMRRVGAWRAAPLIDRGFVRQKDNTSLIYFRSAWTDETGRNGGSWLMRKHFRYTTDARLCEEGINWISHLGTL